MPTFAPQIPMELTLLFFQDFVSTFIYVWRGKTQQIEMKKTSLWNGEIIIKYKRISLKLEAKWVQKAMRWPLSTVWPDDGDQSWRDAHIRHPWRLPSGSDHNRKHHQRQNQCQHFLWGTTRPWDTLATHWIPGDSWMLYLPSCYIQGLSYTRVVLSPYLYLSSFSFSCTFFAIITSFFNPFQVSILPWRKLFCVVQANSNFFLSPLKYSASPFLLNIRSFLSVSYRLFISLYMVIKSPISLFSSSVLIIIFFHLSSYVKFFNLTS